MLRSDDPVTQYAVKVVNGEIIASEKNVKSCQRHLDDLDNPNFKYRFDIDRANHVIDFLEMLPDPKSGKKLKMAEFQKFIVGSIYGWIDKDNYRRYTKAYLSMSRKNGKVLPR